MFIARVPILAYHQITNRALPPLSAPYAVRVAQFEQQMAYLHGQGYRCLSLEKLLTFANRPDLRLHKCFALTFDDGYRDFFTTAFPILKQYGFTATVFLVTERVGLASGWDGEAGYPLLDWEQVLVLFAQGISFGSHTCTHPHLTALPPAALRHELVASRAQLETRLGCRGRWLAYPYGESNAAVRAAVQAAGYQAAFGMNTGAGDLFNVWRCECFACDTPRTFAAKLSRWYQHRVALRSWLSDQTLVGRSLVRVKRRRQQWGR
jgi:peptidoglycan/xylan/chitin deacetylase (PgdA/CDA1 family)